MTTLLARDRVSSPGLSFATAPTASVHRYEPSRSFSRDAVEVSNRLCRRRQAYHSDLEGLPLELGSPRLSDGRDPELGDAVSLQGRWRPEEGPSQGFLLSLPIGTVEQLLAALQPDLVDLPDDPALSLLLELALTPLLERAEACLGGTLTLDSARLARAGSASDDAGGEQADAVIVAGTLGGARFRALLRAESGREDIRSDLLVALAALAETAPVAPAAASFPVLAAFQAGALRLGLAALASLRPGDVLLPDAFPLAKGELAVVLGGKRHASARVESRAARLLDAFQPLPELDLMDDPAHTPAADHPGGLGDVQVDLTFELGRQAIDVAQLTTLVPGYVFDLKRDPAGPIDVLANGRRIGRGEIVKVGDALGVRIVRLFDRDA